MSNLSKGRKIDHKLQGFNILGWAATGKNHLENIFLYLKLLQYDKVNYKNPVLNFDGYDENGDIVTFKFNLSVKVSSEIVKNLVPVKITQKSLMKTIQHELFKNV